MEKMIRMGELFDFYGQLLTERQQEFMVLYYNQDLSLGEIAERFDVTRQAVYDNLRRSEKLLEEYEEKLQLLARKEKQILKIRELRALLEELDCTSTGKKKIMEIIEELI